MAFRVRRRQVQNSVVKRLVVGVGICGLRLSLSLEWTEWTGVPVCVSKA